MAATSKKREITRVVKRHVPEELVREISVRLPCKSLYRFRCVSKLFNSFLQDTEFIDEHRKRNMKPSHDLNWDWSDKTKLDVFSLSRDEYRQKKPYQPTIGWACLYGWESKKIRIALLDPVSGRMVSLTHLPIPYVDPTRNNPGIIPPTTLLSYYVGFGFDLKSQKYKIVQFTFSCCYVLTVNENAATSYWRKIDVPDKSIVNIYFPWHPIYMDGVLYWELAAPLNDMTKKVFAFDLSTEKMSVIDSPAKLTFDKYGQGRHGSSAIALTGIMLVGYIL